MALQDPFWRAVRLFLVYVLAGVFGVAASGAPAEAPGEDEDGYVALRERGDYKGAIEIRAAELEGREPYAGSAEEFAEYADLLFTVGRVDEAIETMERLGRRSSDPAHTLALATYYRYRGRLEEYREALAEAERRAMQRLRYNPSLDTILSLARVLELRGENPRVILDSWLKVCMERMPNEAAPCVAAGDLAWRKYSYDVAAEYYGRALAIDASRQDAIAGLAECYWKSEDPRVEETLERLLALNPNHPRARAIEVERLLDLGDAEQALELIEAALKINPRSQRFLALRAAAQFLQDDAKGEAATRRQVLEFNPHAAEIFTTPARVAARHYRFAEAAALLRQAVAADPEDHGARAELAFNLLRLGKQDEGRRELEQAFKADPYHVQAYNLLQVLDALEKFETIEEGPFRVELPAHEGLVIGREVVATLEDAIKLCETQYAVELTTPVLVQIFDDHDEFMVRSVGLPGNVGHLGICFGRLLTMDSPRARPTQPMNWRAVLWHEFVHVITLQKTNNRMPRWLSEGISVYESARRSPAWAEKLDPRFKPLLDADAWPGLDALEGYFTQPKTRDHLMLGYFLSGEFVACYVVAYGQPALRNALERIARGEKCNQALIEASGASARAIDKAFAQHLAKRCAALKNLPDVPPGDEATSAVTRRAAAEWMRMPSPFTDALRAGAAALAAGQTAEAEKALGEAQRLYPDTSGPESPLRLLARLHQEQGEHAKLEQTLRRIVASDGTALEECRRLVTLLMAQERWAEAAEAAALAFDIDPFDAANLADWQACLIALDKPAEAVAFSEKLVALDKARAIDHRLMRAQLLAESGDAAAAKREALALLEQSPTFYDAQILLLEIVEADGATEAAAGADGIADGERRERP